MSQRRAGCEICISSCKVPSSFKFLLFKGKLMKLRDSLNLGLALYGKLTAFQAHIQHTAAEATFIPPTEKCVQHAVKKHQPTLWNLNWHVSIGLNIFWKWDSKKTINYSRSVLLMIPHFYAQSNSQKSLVLRKVIPQIRSVILIIWAFRFSQPLLNFISKILK